MEIDKTTGLLANIEFLPSPNFNSRPENTKLSMVVVHGISLPEGQYGGDAINQLFTNQLDPKQHSSFECLADLKVSAHVLIRRNGSIIQYVPFTERAWHAGTSCFDGCKNCNDFSIGIELEGQDDELYERLQYQYLADVIRECMQLWPEITVDRIVGHCDIAPGRKTDPGEAFDWVFLRKLLA